MARSIAKRTARSESDAQKLRAMIRRALPPVLAKLYEMALEGDAQAAKILLDRALPALQSIKEPPAVTGSTAREMIGGIVERVLSGEIDATDAAPLIDFVRKHSKGETEARAGLSTDTLEAIKTVLYGAVTNGGAPDQK